MADISRKFPSSARLALICAGLLVVVIAGLALLKGGAKGAKQYDIGIVKLPTENGVEVIYRAYQPIREIEIPFPPEMIGSLSLGEGAEQLSLSAVKDGIRLSSDEPFELAGLVLNRDVPVPPKAYPVAQFGGEALVLNMASFTPTKVEGNRVGLGEAERVFSWVSKAPAMATGHGELFIDPALPEPVSAALLRGLANLHTYYAEAFQQELKAVPQIMALYEPGFDGQLMIEGDTVAGQSLIKFTGKGFAKNSPEAQALVFQNLAHEIGHLYQLENIKAGEAPDWLHEGAADALADEALFMTGLWKAEDYLSALKDAKQACADELKNGPFQKAASNGYHKGSYVCGQTILVAVTAQNQGANVRAMWQGFVSFAQARGEGPSLDTFLAFAEEWTGSETFVLSLKSFLQSDYGLADREAIVEQMFQGTL